MKRTLLSTILCFLLHQSFACDICGCSSGNYFLGPLPQFRSHFFGTRYSFKNYESSLRSDASQFSKDHYQSIELWGGVNIGAKWQLLAFMPYSINKQTSDDGTRNTNGLGDFSVILNRKIFDRRNVTEGTKMISQQLWVGGGLKLPTGKFSPDDTDIIPDANNQPGTGSVDFIANAMYTLHIDNWGINTNMNYKINRSAKDFRFGNRLNTSAFIFHSFANSTGNTTVNPNVGVIYESTSSNTLKNLRVDDTGGNTLFSAAGVELNFAKMVAGCNAQLPICQSLSDGQTKAKVRGMVHVTFLF